MNSSDNRDRAEETLGSETSRLMVGGVSVLASFTSPIFVVTARMGCGLLVCKGFHSEEFIFSLNKKTQTQN